MQMKVQVIAPSDADGGELERFGMQLAQRLKELHPDSLRPETAPPPPAGAKAVEAFTFASIAMSLAPALLPKLIDVVRDLLKARPKHEVRFQVGEITVTLPPDASAEDVARIAEVLAAAGQRAGASHA